MESLSLVLLGIRTAPKGRHQHTSVELVYGTTLHFPGEFFADSSSEVTDTASHVSRLKSKMSKLQTTMPLLHVHPRTYVSPDLKICTHVFVRRDTVGKKLQPPYEGPFQVLKWDDNFYQLDMNRRNNTVSLDRLKPAYLEETHGSSSSSQGLSQPPVLIPIIMS